jgi:hypothetical protein
LLELHLVDQFAKKLDLFKISVLHWMLGLDQPARQFNLSSNFVLPELYLNNRPAEQLNVAFIPELLRLHLADQSV